jgi:hypothetical protein
VIRGLLAQPERLLLAVGGGLMILGALQPWAVGTTAGGDPLSVRPTGGLGEGVYIVFAGVMLLGLAALRATAETTNRVLQLLPAAIALVSTVMWINANRLSLTAIAAWQFGGGSGAQQTGVWLVLAGIVATALAAVLLELRRPAHIRQQTKPLAAELGINRRSVAGAALIGLLGLAGAIIGLSVTVALFGMDGVLPGILLGIFGMVVGLSVGGRLARRLTAAR